MEYVQFPYKIEKLNDEQIANEILGQPNGFVQVGPEKYVLPTSYADFADIIYNFEVRSDDVYICGYPRSGTTWLQEMIWLICNELNFETALSLHTMKRVSFFDLTLLHNGAGNIYESLAVENTRRFIKTHLCFNLLPHNIKEVGAKIVYIARNPKDVAASYYNFHKVNPILQYTGDFESFAQYFMDDLLLFGPYWTHILNGWSHRDDENVHFLFYEDLKMDMENSLKKLSLFLGYPLKDVDLPKLMDHLKFENVKNNKAINFKFSPNDTPEQEFVRRGKVGENPEITEALSKRFDEWSVANLENTGFKFPYY